MSSAGSDGNQDAQQLDSVSVIESYCEDLPGEAEFRIAEVTPSLPERPKPKLGPDLEMVEDQALKLRREAGVPYWHAVILLAEREGIPLTKPMIEAAGFHAGHATQPQRTITSDEVRRGILRKMVHEVREGVVLATLSAIHLPDGEQIDIPMLDFRIKPSPASLVTATRVIEAMGISGYLIDSGNSYHFFGREPVSYERYNTHLLRGLLFAPVTDQRWITHQLIDGESSLRISPRENGGSSPKVVLEL
jgi:hypothetical protein